MSCTKHVLIAVVCGLVGAGTATAGERLSLSDFASGSLAGWETRGFDDVAPSRYDLVDLEQHTVLRGRCDNSASVIGLEREVDLEETPVLNWSWRVEKVFPGIDERSKSGDDFAARVYAVIDGGLLKWRTRAVNYVWAGSEPAGSAWPNPFRDEAMMVAVRSGADKAGQWVTQSRNVKADFKRFYDKDTDHIDGIALMTDCDNHGGAATAYFRDIYFSAQ